MRDDVTLQCCLSLAGCMFIYSRCIGIPWSHTDEHFINHIILTWALSARKTYRMLFYGPVVFISICTELLITTLSVFQYIFLHIIQLLCESIISYTENLGEICRLLEKLQGVICWKMLLSWAEEARNYFHISKKVTKVGSKVVLITSNGLFFNWKYYRSL